MLSAGQQSRRWLRMAIADAKTEYPFKTDQEITELIMGSVVPTGDTDPQPGSAPDISHPVTPNPLYATTAAASNDPNTFDWDTFA